MSHRRSEAFIDRIRDARIGREILLVFFAAGALAVAGCQCKLIPWALAVDPSLTGNSDANGVLEPSETVVVEPTWKNKVTNICTASNGKFGCKGEVGDYPCSKTVVETGTAASLTGPLSGDYVIGDSAAFYGTIPSNQTREPVEGYALFVSAPTGRPSRHWDAHLTENLTGTSSKTTNWAVHIGSSFRDVPRSHPFYAKIETLLHRGVTAGCTESDFCPDQPVSREQIAMLLARQMAGGADKIPAAGQIGAQAYDCSVDGESLLTDVRKTDASCKHIHYLIVRHVIPLAFPLQFRPSETARRDEMAELVARAVIGNLAPPAYGPDPVTQRSYSCDPARAVIHFADVPASDPFCPYAHYLWAKGVVAGCSESAYCPDGDITRGQTAKFLVNAFGLTLYGL